MLNNIQIKQLLHQSAFVPYDISDENFEELQKVMLNYPNLAALKDLYKEDLLSIKHHYGMMRDAFFRKESNRPTTKKDAEKFLTPLKWNALTVSAHSLQEYLKSDLPHYLNLLRRDFFNASISNTEKSINTKVEDLNITYKTWEKDGKPLLDPIERKSVSDEVASRLDSYDEDYKNKYVRVQTAPDKNFVNHYINIR